MAAFDIAWSAEGATLLLQVPRGGQTTFHGPGQLVAYPVMDLPGNKLSTRCYVSTIEKILIEICRMQGLAARTTENTGVWVGGRNCPGKVATENAIGVEDQERKIGAIGIHITRGLSQHGFALNVSTDLDWFNHIVACGLVGLGTTSIVKEYQLATSAVLPEVRNDPTRMERSKLATVESVVPDVIKAFSSVLARPMVPLSDSSPETEYWIRNTLAQQRMR